MTKIEKEVLEDLHRMNREIDYLSARLRNELGHPPCSATCFSCCLNTSTLLISKVEGLDIKEGLKQLPRSIQEDIYEKVRRTIIKIDSLGFTEEELIQGKATTTAKLMRGTPESKCMMLVGGACAIYDYRPLICRVWGYPMKNGDEISCCYKTFLGKRNSVKPLNFSLYWRICRDLSSKIGAEKKTPFCYMVKRFLDDILSDNSM